MTRGTSLAGVLTSAPPWAKLVEIDGTSVAGLTDLGANTWASTGSAIEVTQVDNNPSYLFDAAAIDEFAPLVVVQAEVQLPSTSVACYGGIALIPSASGPESPDSTTGSISLLNSGATASVHAAGNDSGVDVALDAWIELRIEVAFGVARFLADGVVVTGSWIGNQWYNAEKPQGFAMGMPALYARFNGPTDGPLYRNLVAWTSNPGPFS